MGLVIIHTTAGRTLISRELRNGGLEYQIVFPDGVKKRISSITYNRILSKVIEDDTHEVVQLTVQDVAIINKLPKGTLE